MTVIKQYKSDWGNLIGFFVLLTIGSIQIGDDVGASSREIISVRLHTVQEGRTMLQAHN